MGGAPAITQLFHLVRGDPQLGGRVLPTGRAQPAVPARAGLGMRGSPTRTRASLGVAPGPRRAPAITQLLHQTGGDPPSAGLALPMGQAQGVATGHTGLGTCDVTTHARAGLGVGVGLRGTPATTQLLHLEGVTPRLGGVLLPTGQAQ